MKITIIAVGKLKEKYLSEGIKEYSKGIAGYCDFEIVEVEDEQAPEGMSRAQEEQVKKREAVKILKKLKDNSMVITLEIKGEKLSTGAFAKKLGSFFISGKTNITFIIGGSLGLDSEISKKAALKLSISDMTFPHQLCRLMLTEQLLRALRHKS